MKIVFRRLFAFIILVSLLGLGSCEKSDNPDCVNCWDEPDPEVNWVYNALPTKLCHSDPTELQRQIDLYESKGYNCGEIK